MNNIQSKTATQATFRLLYELVRLSMVVGLTTVSFGYLMPTALAIANDRRDQLSIFFFNLILGWTVIGWFVAWFWARKKFVPKSPEMDVV